MQNLKINNWSFTKQGDKDNLNEWERLANAIIARAAYDYRLALCRCLTSPDIDEKAEIRVSECKIFFTSKWFTALTSLDPVAFMEELERDTMERIKCRI